MTVSFSGPHLRTRLAGWVVFIGVLVFGAPLVRARAAKAKTLVLIAAKNRPRVARRALQALRSQLSDTTVKLRVVRVKRHAKTRAAQLALSRKHAALPGVLAVAWYDASQPNEILMLAARTKRLVVRRVTGASVGGRLEALAIIVRTSMLALLAGQPLPPQPPPRRRVVEPRRVEPRRVEPRRVEPRRVEPRRVEPRRVEPRRVEPRRVEPRRVVPRRRPPPRRTASPPSGPQPWRFGLGLEAGYFVSGYSTDAGAVHGGEVAVSFHLRAGWELLLSYRITQKVIGRVGAASRLDLQPHPVGVGARWRHRWGRFELGLALSFILDYATLSTDVDPTTHEGVSDPGDLLLSVMPTVSVGVYLARRVRLVLGASAQIGLNWRRYVLDEAGTTQTLLHPWPVHPCLMAGLAVDVI